MKVLQVIPGISRKSGGPSRSVQGLVAGLNRAGVETWLMVVVQGEEPWVEGVNHFVNGEPFQEVVARIKPDIVHLHSIWGWGIHRCAAICRRLRIPYVISPRGMLDPWALSVKKWKKRIARWLYQDHDLRGAAAFHATAEMEAQNIRKQGLRQPIIIAPNAVNVAESKKCECEKVRTENQERVALFMGRLHPGKGLLTLAEAWAKVRPQGWRMKVVGPDNYGHKKEVIAALNRLGIADEWEFCEPLDDVQKWDAYRSADLLIHPSVSENFGVTIAEGLAAGLPVICTKGAPWKDIEEHKCGWWIDIGVEQLARALQAALSLRDKERQAMGESGRMLIAEKYTWDAVAERMIKGYEEVLK